MTVLQEVVVDSGKTFVAGSKFVFNHTLTRDDGGVYDLSGRTVRATIRKESDGDRVLDSTLEDIAVTVSVAATGSVTFLCSAAQSAFMMPPTFDQPPRTRAYVAQYFVVEDDYYPQMVRFYMRRKVN